MIQSAFDMIVTRKEKKKRTNVVWFLHNQSWVRNSQSLTPQIDYIHESWMENFAEAYDPLDPSGNITIKWDLMTWTADGYEVSHMNSHLMYLSEM